MSFSSEQDEACVKACATGDQSAMGQLYDRHAEALLRVATQLVGTGRAEDLVHDTFLEAWRHATSYDKNRGSVRSWLLVRLRSRCLDLLRKDKVRARRAETIRSGDVPAQVSETIEFDASKAILALESLPKEQAEVLWLMYFEDRTARQVAQELAIPVGTVKSRGASALSKIRRIFEGER